ncbi:MAG: RDD family protein [bacterium]
MIETKYRTFWRRVLAGWVDSLAFLPVQIGSHYIWEYHGSVPLWLLAAWNFFPSLIWYGYNVYFLGKFGRTIGKMAAGVKVIDQTEAKPIKWKALGSGLEI